MKKISLIVALAIGICAVQTVKAQDRDTNKVELKKKVKTTPKGHTTTKTKIEGSGTAGKAAVEANGSRPISVHPTTVVVSPAQPAPTQIVTVPATPPEPAKPTTTVTTTTTTKATPVVQPVVKTTKTTTTHVYHKTVPVTHKVVKKTPSATTTTTTTVKN